MKRCSLCNDLLIKNPKEDYYEGKIIECFICGTKYQVKMEWKTFEKNGMKETVNLPRLSII